MARNDLMRDFYPKLFVFDAPSLFNGNENTAGIYVGATTGGLGQGTDTASLRVTPDPISVYMSRDGGTTYHELVDLLNHVDSGIMESLVASSPISKTESNIFLKTGSQLATGVDKKSELTVTWRNTYVPSSVTDAELNNGQNKLIVGDSTYCEVVQYKTVSAVTASVGAYRHTHLLRGRHGTENQIANQIDYAEVVAVNDNLIFVPLTAGDVGRTLLFKAIVGDMSLSDVEVGSEGYASVDYKGRNVSPFAPAQVTGTRDSSNNLTISWKRRTRYPVRLLGYNNRPLGEDVEEYQVEILSGGAPYSVLRTIDATTTSCTYTASQHSSDSLTAGGAVNLRVYQKSNYTGRGQTGLWTIPANTGGTGSPTVGATYLATRGD